MRKLYIIGLPLLLILTIVLFGCNNEKKAGNSDSHATENNSSEVTANNEFPIVKDKITLSVLFKGNEDVLDMDTNDFSTFLEEKTNIHMDWQTAYSNWQQKLNLAISSGDLPDIFMNMDVSQTQIMSYADDGIIIPLQDLIEKYAPNTKRMLDENPEIRSAITTPDGSIYAVPRVNECYHCTAPFKMYVYQPWLEAVDMKMPTTTEEFEQMLIAFVNKDPNGNNKKDEIGLAGAISHEASKITTFLMNSFVYDDGKYRLLLEDGKIGVAYSQPAWKDGVTYLNGLYAKGLISPQSFTQDRDSLMQMTESPDKAIVGVVPGASKTAIAISNGSSNRWLEYQAMAPLKGPGGVQLAATEPYRFASDGQFMITKENKHAEASIRWMDTFMINEVALREVFGVKGRDWIDAESGDKGRDGQPALYKVINGPSGQMNQSWDQVGPGYLEDEVFYLGRAVTQLPDKEKMHYDDTKEKYEPYKQNLNQIVPPLIFTTDEAEQLSKLQTELSAYYTSMTAKFIIGDADIDKEWDKYVETLNRIGLEKYVSIYQQAYDRKMGK